MTQSVDENSIERRIAEHGASLAAGAGDSNELGARLDKLELAIEEAGRTAVLTINVDSYVTDLRNDLKALRRTRFWLVIAALLFVVSLNGVVLVLMFGHGVWYWMQDTYFKAAIFLGSVTATVVLLSIMLKGGFHSLSERSKEGDMPPHIKEIVDAVKLALGK